MLRILLFAVLFLLTVNTAYAQKTASDYIAIGDSASAQQKGPDALKAYRSALEIDSTNADLIRKFIFLTFAVIEGRASFASPSQLYDTAQMFAERLYQLDSTSAETHFALTQMEILHTRVIHSHDQLMDGFEVYKKIRKCLAIDANHPGCSTLMGSWYVEVLREGADGRLEYGLNRLKDEDKIKVSDIYLAVSWDSAMKYLEHSVKLEPNRAVHLYQLATAYLLKSDTSKAVSAYEKVLSAPSQDFNDEHYKRRSRSTLAILTRNKK